MTHLYNDQHTRTQSHARMHTHARYAQAHDASSQRTRLPGSLTFYLELRPPDFEVSGGKKTLTLIHSQSPVNEASHSVAENVGVPR